MTIGVRPVRRVTAAILLLALLLLAAPGHIARTLDERSVEEVCAAFIFRFLYYLKDQPRESPDGELCIGVLGPDPFGSVLDEADGRVVHGSRVRIRRFASVDEVEACEIVFVSPELTGGTDAAARELGTRPVLTVSTADGFAERNGMVELLLLQDRVRFDINQRIARRSGVQLDAELLEVARKVYR